jgi:hypothetical protein
MKTSGSGLTAKCLHPDWQMPSKHHTSTSQQDILGRPEDKITQAYIQGQEHRVQASPLNKLHTKDFASIDCSISTRPRYETRLEKF